MHEICVEYACQHTDEQIYPVKATQKAIEQQKCRQDGRNDDQQSSDDFGLD
jgi:hypothetical protein